MRKGEPLTDAEQVAIFQRFGVWIGEIDGTQRKRGEQLPWGEDADQVVVAALRKLRHIRVPDRSTLLAGRATRGLRYQHGR